MLVDKDSGKSHYSERSLRLRMEEPFTMDALHRKDSWKFKLFSSKLELWAKSDTVHFMSVFHVPLGSTCVVSMT